MARALQVVKALDAATGDGLSAVTELPGLVKDFQLWLIVSGKGEQYPTGDAQVALEGSLDGSNWLVLITQSSLGANGTKAFQTSGNYYVKFIRVKISQYSTGTGTPVITASVVVGEE